MNPQEKTAHTFRFTFRSSLKQNYFLALIGVLGIAGTGLVQLAYTFRNGLYNAPDAPITDFAQMRELIDFQLFLGYVSSALGTAQLFAWLILAIAALLGISLFHFTQNRKRYQCYCALGLSRAGMLWSRLLAGIVLLSAAVIVPISLLVCVNLALFGSSALLWNAALYAAGSLLLLGFFTLGIVALAFGSVGVPAEALAFSGILLTAPDLALLAFYNLTDNLIQGVPKLIYGSVDSLIPGTLPQELPHPSGLLRQYSPLRFFVWHLRGAVIHAPGYAPAVEPPAPISLRPLLGFALAAAGVFALTTLVFHRRRAELCGVPGHNRILNFFGISMLSFCAVSLLFPLEAPFAMLLPKLFPAIVSLFACAMIYLLAQLFLQRSPKKTLRELWMLPLHLAPAGLALLIFSTGLLGYAVRVPKAQEVQSVSMQPMTDLPLLRGRSYGGYVVSETAPRLQTSRDIYAAAFLAGYPEARLEGISDPALIQKIIDLQREIAAFAIAAAKEEAESSAPIADSIPTHLLFFCQMKNGKSFIRFFSVSDAALLEKLALLQNELARPYYDAILQPPEHPIPVSFQPLLDRRSTSLNNFRHSIYDPDVGIVLQSRFLDSVEPILLPAEKKLALIDALRADLTAQTAEERLFPQSPALALLKFDSFPENFSKADLIDRTLRQTTGRRGNGFVDYNVHGPLGNLAVTEDMENTLQFLRQEGLLTGLQNIPKFVCARVVSALPFQKSLTPTLFSSHRISETGSLEFMGIFQKIRSQAPSISATDEIPPSDYAPPQSVHTFAGDALIAALAQNAHPKYFISRGGYIVEFETAKGEFVTLFVPAEKMPQEIAKAVLP